MARQRELLVNIERMRREMDEFFGDDWAQSRPAGAAAASRRASTSTTARTRASGAALAVVKADLAGVDPDAVRLEVSRPRAVISGARPVRETEGRAYQQVEIPTGAFRREIELGVEVVAEQARATFEDGVLRVELPVKVAGQRRSRSVPIERADDGRADCRSQASGDIGAGPSIEIVSGDELEDAIRSDERRRCRTRCRSCRCATWSPTPAR